MRTVDRLAGWPVGAPESGSALLVAVSTVLWAGAMVGLVGAGFGAWGARPLAARWPRLAVAGAGASLFLLVPHRPDHFLPGIVLSGAALLLLGLAPRRSGAPSASGGGSAPPGRRPGVLGRARDGLALVLLLWITLAIGTRPWHMRWGSTDAELALGLPGDELATEPLRYGIQHAVTIRAPADRVWPWLVQIGQDRAGFYSYDGLERLFGVRIENVDRIVPEWQSRAAGDSVFATQPGYLGLFEARLGWRVARVEVDRALVLENWGAFVLELGEAGTTRLIARTRGGGPGSTADLVFAPAGLLLFEIPHFIMQRRMLLGIRDRAEAGAGVARDSGPRSRDEANI